MNALNDSGKPLKNSSILVLGISYKKNIDDMRESPSVELIKILIGKGANVSYSDPFFPRFPPMRKYRYNMDSVELTQQTISKFDIVLLATDHDIFDYELIAENSSILVDTRGRFASGSNIVRA